MKVKFKYGFHVVSIPFMLRVQESNLLSSVYEAEMIVRFTPPQRYC